MVSKGLLVCCRERCTNPLNHVPMGIILPRTMFSFKPFNQSYDPIELFMGYYLLGIKIWIFVGEGETINLSLCSIEKRKKKEKEEEEEEEEEEEAKNDKLFHSFLVK